MLTIRPTVCRALIPSSALFLLPLLIAINTILVASVQGEPNDPAPSPLYERSLQESVDNLHAEGDGPPAGYGYERAQLSMTNSVVVESKAVGLNSTDVTIDVSYTNSALTEAITLPLEFRTVSGGAFISDFDTVVIDPSLNAVTAFMVQNAKDVPAAQTCSGPVSSTWSGAPPFAPVTSSPYSYLFSGVATFGAVAVHTTSQLGWTLIIDVNGSPGDFEIDTCCWAPGNHLIFSVSGTPVVPSFTKGIVTLLPSASGGTRRGDVNCDGYVDVDDVNAYNDYFNNGTPLTCVAASDVNGDAIPLTPSDLVYLIRIVNGSAPISPDCIPGCDCCNNRVRVGSKAVQAGETDVSVGVFIENLFDLEELTLPLEIRSITAGSFIAGSVNLDLNPAGRAFAANPSVSYSPYGMPKLTNTCSGPVSRTYEQAGPANFDSPDALLLQTDFDSGCLPAGSDNHVPSYLLTFGVTSVDGSFQIDTCCIEPSQHLLFVECGTGTPVAPDFFPGLVTIVAPPQPTMQASCPGQVTCQTTTCPGEATCYGTSTCAPQASCQSASCVALQTCAPNASCAGIQTCAGTQTCYPAPTCAGMSTCVQTPTSEAMPSCPGWQTCTICDITTMRGTPTCVGWPSCPAWASCGGEASCDNVASCQIINSCGNWGTCTHSICDASPECIPYYIVPTFEGSDVCTTVVQPPPTIDNFNTCDDHLSCFPIVPPGQQDLATGIPTCNGSKCSDPDGGPSAPKTSAPATAPFSYPVVFSVDGPTNSAEGLLQPDPLAPAGHPVPNDVYALGPANGYLTPGELFQSSGSTLGAAPDMTNVDRLSASLGIGPAPTGLPFHGPFAPNPGASAPFPAAPGSSLQTLGLVSGDNINALSFGRDGGNVLLFSVDPGAVGAAGTAVEYQSSISPISGVSIGTPAPSNGGGDPGNEAAGDLFVSAWYPRFGNPAVTILLDPAVRSRNELKVDESQLGLQAPASHWAIPLGADEDDLDAVEVADASIVDSDGDGVPSIGTPVFFSLRAGAASFLSHPGTSADDILLSPPPGGPQYDYAVFADGVLDIGLLPGDDLDALCLWDADGDGVLDPGSDVALFSLAAGSPSLVPGANPNMPPPPYSPGDVYGTAFSGPAGPILYYARAADLGLAINDELNALDIGDCYCDYRTDLTYIIGDICRVGYTHWGFSVTPVLPWQVSLTYGIVGTPGTTSMAFQLVPPTLPLSYRVLLPPGGVTFGPSPSLWSEQPVVLGTPANASADGGAYLIMTSATYADTVELWFAYDEDSVSGDETGVRILQYVETAPGDSEWVDITRTVDTENNRVCGRTLIAHGHFAVGEFTCACDCFADPVCDLVVNVFDVVKSVDVAFRAGAPVVDPNPACPREDTDVTCDNVTNVFDVVKFVDVAFRAANPATAFCDPCG